MAQIIFIDRQGRPQVCAFAAGETVLSVAHRFEVDLEGVCGGAMACSTCHVKIKPPWYAMLPTATSEETDMLDLAPNVGQTSRLGCQIKLTENLNGITVRLP